MSTTHNNEPGRTTLSLSRESEWVVHDVVLDELLGEDADRPLWAVSVAQQLEGDGLSVTGVEGRRLRDHLREYLAGETPERDVEPTRRVLESLDARLGPSR
jgi:hypothetical protein